MSNLLSDKLAELGKLGVSRLLKSWATPPASRPSDSNLCAFSSWASFSLSDLSAFPRSVTSRPTSTHAVTAPFASRTGLATFSQYRSSPEGSVIVLTIV